MRSSFVLISCLLAAATIFAGTPEGVRAIESVTVHPQSGNPTAGGEFAIEVNAAAVGRLLVQVIDRDGFVVRTLANGSAAVRGLNRYVWNGRGEDGALVADEAYSLRVVWSGGKQSETYFPSDRTFDMTPVPVRYFSAATGTIVFDLPRPSRVHLQAGVAALDPRTKSMEGPVLKTVVNREPRAGGRIAEQWNGFDESGLLYVPDMANFVMSIATTPLPENSLIVVGNRQRTFLEQVSLRKGRSLFTHGAQSHAHHGGLTALDDVSPPLSIEPINATWSEVDKVWTMTSRGPLRVRLSLKGPAAKAFAAQPAALYRFANSRLIDKANLKAAPHVVEIPARRLDAEINIVSINWESRYGGVAANSIRVRRLRSPSSRASK